MPKFSSVNVKSIDRLLEDGDASVRSKVVTAGPEFYTAPSSICTAADLRSKNSQFQAQFVSTKTIEAPGQYLVFLRDCYVLPNAAIVTSEGNVIEESCFPYTTEARIEQSFTPWIYRDNALLNANLGDAVTVTEPLFYLREHGEMGFFHWMHSVLPRIQLFLSNGFSPSFSILGRRRAQFQREALDFCKLSDLKFTDPDERRPMFVRELVFPAPLVQQGDFWLRPPSVCRFYDQFFSAVPDGPKRVYITRNDATIRRIANEIEILDVLGRFGFESVELGRLSFTQQVSLMRGTEIAVSAHGAGLSHIVNMPRFSTVLEILHPQRFWATYRALSARRDVKYAAVIGVDPNPTKRDDASDFEVDPEKVIQVLAMLDILSA